MRGRRTDMRPRTVAVGGLLALSLTVAGCSGDEPGPPDPSPTSAQSSAPAQVPLDLSVYGPPETIAAYQAIADAYMAQNPDIVLEVDELSDPASAAEATLADIAAGSGPDLFLVDQDYLPRFVSEGLVEPVDILLEDRGLDFGDGYQRVALTAFSANAGLQCMPVEMSPRVVYYNKQLVPRLQLAAAGIELPTGPETWDWDEFVAAARAAAIRHQSAGVKGAHLPSDLEVLTAMVRSAGSEIVDSLIEPTSLTLTSDTATETITTVAELTQDQSVSLTPREVAASAPLERFLDGGLAFYVGTRADLPAILAQDGLRFDVLPLPLIDLNRSISDITGLCINAATDHVSEAADFLAYAVGPEGARIQIDSTSMVPTSLESLLDPAFTAPGGRQLNSDAYATGVRRSDVLPYAEAWPEVSAQAAAVLARIYYDPNFDMVNRLGPVLERLNARSEVLFSGEIPSESPSESPSPSDEPTS